MVLHCFRWFACPEFGDGVYLCVWVFCGVGMIQVYSLFW